MVLVWLPPRAACTAEEMAGLRVESTELTTASWLSELELLLEPKLEELMEEPLFDAKSEELVELMGNVLEELIGNVLEELIGNVLEELMGNVFEELMGNVLEEPLFPPKLEEPPRVELEKLLSLEDEEEEEENWEALFAELEDPENCVEMAGPVLTEPSQLVTPLCWAGMTVLVGKPALVDPENLVEMAGPALTVPTKLVTGVIVLVTGVMVLVTGVIVLKEDTGAATETERLSPPMAAWMACSMDGAKDSSTCQNKHEVFFNS